ncbi:TetR/AcrR family transcriptional regulator [Tsukamurella tyrosinosolvens]|uniref:TetR/AcrR family transcriptional regulator n=1 Tax=Tsukamurella tyrosinosolvens TaxID=57704 RepID=UPI000C7F4B72|nr:TetR/AcrR family transcriptional regulator [Tsukamurella tyrosinosolvens]AUN40818.1 TetR family transcriptional regulator [Tsukamurella tyrosinosolvens]
MREDKRQDLLRGAVRVFAADGFSRASIQSLAAEAGVSTRTIYNQYGNKEDLFRAVVLDSATRVAERQIAVAEKYLARVADLRADLIAFGRAWSVRDPESRDHFRMVAQINADVEHIAPDVLAGWRAAGPDRVRAAIGELLVALDGAGRLRIEDGELAAVHLINLTAGSVGGVSGAGRALAHAEEERIVAAGVDAFLAAYGR